MKFKTFLFVIAFVVPECLSQDSSSCEDQIEDNDEGPNIDWEVNMLTLENQTDDKPPHLAFNYRGELSLTFPDESEFGAKYIDIVTENNTLIFRGNENYTKIEEDSDTHNYVQGNEILFQRKVKLTCDSGDITLKFIINIKDTNNHYPTFDKDTYSYEMPMPLIPNIDLTGFGDEIIVTDYDFTNKDVTFTIDNADFEVTTKHSADSNSYLAVLKVKSYTFLSNDVQLTLTATDSGEPPLSNTTTIQIKIDESNSLPDIPTVPEASYQFDYTIDEDKKPTLTPLGGDIIVTASDSSKLAVELKSSDIVPNDYFTVELEEDTQKVTIKPTDKVIESSPNPVLVLTLVVTLNGKEKDSSKTAILVNLPTEKVITIPQFGSAYYEAQYKVNEDKDTVELSSEITVTEDAEITLMGEEKHFSISKVDDKWQVSVLEDLDSSDFKKGDIPLTLQATVVADKKSYVGFATLIVNLPKVDLRFTKPYYTATYIVNDGDVLDTLTVDGDIALTSPSADVTVELVDTNSDHFKIEKKSDGSGYDLSLVSNLDDSVLVAEADVVLTLKATLGGDVGEGTLVVKLPKRTAPASFKQPNYVAVYNMDTDPHTIDMDGIELEGDYLDETVVTLQVDGGLKDYFTISDKSPYKVGLSKNLDDTILNSQHEVVVTVIATLDKTSTTTSVIVTIPDLPTPPNFKSSVYYGKYDSDNKIVTLDNPIETDAKDSSIVHITAEKPYDTNFAVEYDKTEGFTVKVTGPLDDDTVQNNNEIFVVFDATVDRAVAHTSATLVLKMPTELSQIVPKFSESFYNAQYNDDKTVTIKSPITITSDKASETQVEVIDDYKGYFGAEFDGTSWQLKMIKELETSLTEIVVTLEASLAGDDIKTTTTVIMTLPNHDLTPSPKFAEPLYEAEYVDDEPPSLKITDPITLKDGFKDATVTVDSDGYKEYFNLAQNKDNALQWDISLNKPLTDDILKNNMELVVTLKSDLDNSEGPEYATLVIKLPSQSQETISFGESYYTAIYTVEKGKDTINSSEITVSDGATVTVTKDYADYFDINCANKKCVLSVKQDLGDDVLKTKNEIIVVLQATKTGIAEKPTVPVIVSLPLQDSIEAPKFEQLVYTADYDKESNTISANSIKFTDTEAKDIKLAIDSSSEYKDNFKVTLKTDHWEVEVSQSLDVSGKVSISFILQATKVGVETPGQAVFVVNLPGNEDTSVLEFSQVTYTGKYNVKDTTDEVVLEQNIQINGISDTSKAVLSIETGNNKENFEIKASEDSKDQWLISVKTDLPDTVLDTETSIVLTLKATVVETSSSGEVGVVINLPKAYTPTSFYFNSTSYTADYEIKNDKPKLTMDKSILVENDPNSTATTVHLSGDFAEYFAANYSQGTVTIILSSTAIPDETVEKQSALPVTIEAKKDDNKVARAVLVVRLPKETSKNDNDDSSDDQTGLIAAVAVLAVLLVASLVGSAVFYYFKFKTAKNYNNMSNSPRPSERFRKNSAGLDTKHKFEHASRRPTGVIKYPLKDDESTDCVEEPISEKRKSVQFDIIHIDELEIEPDKTDDEDNENTYENVDSDSDRRRNSEA